MGEVERKLLWEEIERSQAGVARLEARLKGKEFTFLTARIYHCSPQL